MPLFEEELRNAAAVGLEAGQERSPKTRRGRRKPLLEELFKGLIRTVKTGEFDVVGAVRGPDKNDWYTALGAIAFEDPSKLEKEFKTFVEKNAPPDGRRDQVGRREGRHRRHPHVEDCRPGGFPRCHQDVRR